MTKKQIDLLCEATSPLRGLDLSELLKTIESRDCKIKITEGKLESSVSKDQKKTFTIFEKALPKHKKNYFIKELKPHIDSSGNIDDPLENFNLNIAQRWIFNRVIELGYNPKLYYTFDSMIDRYYNTGRAEHKVERIGKKYQWIAYHEFMALLSDHFEFNGYNWNDLPEKYIGPWEPHIRDIDSTFIIKNDNHIKQCLSLRHWKLEYATYNA